MKCIYCQKILNKNNAKSIEHIIPESLGNKLYILSPNLICDKCNNYFAREIEKPFLELQPIRLLRSLERIPNKKKKYKHIPILLGDYETTLAYEKDSNSYFIGLPAEAILKLIKSPPKKFISKKPSIESLLNNQIVSRFLCKIFTEYLIELLQKKYKRKIYLLKALLKDDILYSVFKYVRFGNRNLIYKYEVNEKQNYNPFVYGDGTLAKIDFIKENDLHIFIFTWSCLEFKLYINSKSKLNPPSTNIDFGVRIG